MIKKTPETAKYPIENKNPGIFSFPKNSLKFVDLSKSIRRLFYRNGYFRTGMRDISSEAGMSLSNLYSYFPSKDAIGMHYLEEEERDQITSLTKLMEANPDPYIFFRVWLLSKKTDARKGVFIGCPFSSFSHQSESLDQKMLDSIKRFSLQWEKILTSYINNAILSNYLSPLTDAENLAQRILSFYQGTIAMWRMSKEKKYWKILEQLIYEELDRNST